MPNPTNTRSPLWALTAFFNPLGFQNRLRNYRVFRSRLSVPLIAVEMSCGSDFQLTGDDADILIRVGNADVMFQKERLLNVGLAAVPGECEAVVWLDCDIVFEDGRWAERTLDALQRYRLVQTFQEFHEMPPHVSAEEVDECPPAATRRGWAAEWPGHSLASDILATDFRLRGLVSGGAMACRREILDETGFYDACIMGSGVRALVAAAIGRPMDAVHYLHCGPEWQQHYEAWAERWYDAVRGSVGSVEGAVRHLWHGDLADRRYGPRHEEFSRFGFDPRVDVRVNESGGFVWASDKPDMHRFVRNYMSSRREDG